MLLNMKKGPSGFQRVQGEQGDSGGPSSMLVTPHDSTERGEQVTQRTAPPPPRKAGITTACGRDLTETPGCAEQVTNQVSRVGRLHERRLGHTGALRGQAPHPAPSWRETIQRPALWVATVTCHGLRRAGSFPRASVGAASWPRGRDPGCAQSSDLRLNLASVPRAHALQQRSYHS